MRNIAVLGSTGSIGTQTLDVVRNNSQDLSICALSCDRNIDLLEKQIREFKPEIAAVYNEEAARNLSIRIKDTGCKVLSGMKGLIAISEYEKSDILVTAIVGMIGIMPTIHGIKAGKDIALANKETLVCAGHIIMPLAKDYGVKILPVDSEHSAIFQCLQGNEGNTIKKILLTCSGGAFRGYSKSSLESVTLEGALNHPTWKMGKKITVDCATLANKGLEVMEAKWLFNVEPDQVQVVIHPQSIVHSMVMYDDDSVIAQLSNPDMKLPINYALFYPERRPLDTKQLEFWDICDLHFEKPDTDTFPALRLAYEAIKTGGSMPAVFNAANEYAASEFLHNRIMFSRIPEIIAEAMSKHKVIENPTVDDILAIKEEYEF